MWWSKEVSWSVAREGVCIAKWWKLIEREGICLCEKDLQEWRRSKLVVVR
jgi:hypothetical protein